MKHVPHSSRQSALVGSAVIAVFEEEDALQRIINVREPLALILLSQVGQSLQYWLDVGRGLSQQSLSFSHMPIVIVAEQYAME